MINCRRPSNRSSRLALPSGPTNSYFFSTASHGIRRRSAASASRERVKAFSFTRSCWRAASHSCCDTIGGVLIARCPFGCSLFLSLFVAILFLLCFLKQTETIRFEKSSELTDAQFVAAPRELLLGLGQLEPRCEPFFACPGHVLRHGLLLFLDGEVRLVKNLTDLNHVAFVGGAPLRPFHELFF